MPTHANFHHIFVYGWIEMCGFFAYLYQGPIHIINVVWGLNSYTHDTLWDEITHQYPEGGLTKLWLNGKTWMINFVQNFYVGTLIYHYSDVIKWRLKSPALRLFIQTFIQVQIKENIKALRHWPLWGEFTGDQWNPHTKGQ